MHSRIFQIETHFCPKEEHITQDGFAESSWFLDNIADYIDDTTPEYRIEDIERLQSALGTEKIEWNLAAESFILREGFKELFFAPYHEQFMKELEALTKTTTLEAFVNPNGPSDLAYSMYKLNRAYDEKFGFYIASNENELQTLHQFIRYAEYDKPYYIGGILDYHH